MWIQGIPDRSQWLRGKETRMRVCIAGRASVHVRKRWRATDAVDGSTDFAKQVGVYCIITITSSYSIELHSNTNDLNNRA